MISQFDGLEDRFLANQANVKLYEELRRRHQTVSEVACANQGEHYTQMVEHLEQQEEKGRKLRRRHLAEVDEFSLSRTTVRAGKKQRAHD